MNLSTLIPLLLQYAPGAIAWLIAEQAKITPFIKEAETLIASLTASGTPPATAQTTGGLALVGQLLSHAATTYPASGTPAVTSPQ